MRRALLLVSACVALLVGCTSEGEGRAGSDPPLRAQALGSGFQQDPVVPENGTAPEAFLDRKRLPSCGSYAWVQGEEPPEDVWRCLAKSRESGRSAEVIVQSPGMDNISVGYYRVTGADDVSVWMRDVQDDRWARVACAWTEAEGRPGPCEAIETFD